MLKVVHYRLEVGLSPFVSRGLSCLALHGSLCGCASRRSTTSVVLMSLSTIAWYGEVEGM